MFFFHCSIISFQPLTKLKSVMWFTHLNYIIAPGFCFCHHPSERQDQEESSQISVVCSHPTTWASASHGIHWSIPRWFSRASRILEALVIAQATSPSCSSRPALAIARRWCKVHLGWQQSYHRMNCILFDRKCRCESHQEKAPVMADGYLDILFNKLIWVLLNIDLFPHVFCLPHLVETSLRRLDVPHIQGDITINRRLRLAPLVGSDLSCHCLVTQCHLNELNCVAMVCWFQFWWLFKLQTS